MKELNDVELLEAYASERSEDAFRELVARHIDFIYSAALRQLRNSQLAEEATQSAFIALAGKAGRLQRNTAIAGWLHRAAHFAALNLQRSEARRKHWEEEAATVNISADAGGTFQEAALSQIDGALAELNESDRGAVILRFLQQQSFHDMARTLGTSEEAVKKRVSRALERLRRLLAQRGIPVSAAVLGAGLSQLPVTAAPATLVSTVATLALRAGVPTVSISAAILKLLIASKVKLAVTSGLVILAGIAALLWFHDSSNTATASTSPIMPGIPKIKLASVMVDDQDKALKFYTETLGFVKKIDVPTGEPGGGRWLTVVSPDEPEGTQVLLEPIGFPFARTYQKALFDAGIPWTAFFTGDIRKHVERLKSLGVKFSQQPVTTGSITTAIFDDTCSNRIQLVQALPFSNTTTGAALKIKLNSILVEDVDRALKFYTETVGFIKKRDMPLANGRWVTVVSPEEPEGAELLLEPTTGFPAARTFQEAVRKAGIPFTQLAVANANDAYKRMTSRGVVFRQKPAPMGPITLAVFEDGCGNLIQLLQQ
jgi:RNA polymerase sigma factor (sigma-70 family)